MRLVISICLLFLVACNSNGPSIKLFSLPSGKQIKLLKMTKTHFAGGDTVLILDYQTDLDLDNKAALDKEVDEIWQQFKIDVEKANLKTGGIRACAASKGTFVQTQRKFSYAFHKSDDGTWVRK